MAYLNAPVGDDEEVIEMPPDVVYDSKKQKQAVMPLTFLLLGAMGVWFLFFEKPKAQARSRARRRR